MSYQGPPQPGPTPNYTQTYPPMTSYDQGAPFAQGYTSDAKEPYSGGRFKPRKSVNDPVFLIIFIATVLGFAALSGFVLRSWISNSGLGGGLGKPGAQAGMSVTLNRGTVYLLLLITAAAVLLSSIYLILARAFTRILMHITLLLSILLNVGICIYYWITRYYSGAIIFTVIALLSILAYWGYKSRIPLATLLLQVVMDVSKHHLSVYVVAFTALFFQAALGVWYIFTVIATYAKWTPGSPSCSSGTSCSTAKVAGLIVFETFALLWASQVVANVSLATLAGGPYGCWYYLGPKRSFGGGMPTISAFSRASTLSLGSIAFGSLIVTILDLIKLILETFRNVAAEDGNPVVACLACCTACFIGCIRNLVEYFNRYAYVEIALYGKAYIPAARDTWKLFKDRGIDALVNDSLVGMMLTWGAYIVGLLSSLFAYIYLRVTAPTYNAEGQYTAPLLLFAFLIGLLCSLTMSSAIEAGVSTIFVGLAEDPQVLQSRAPELFGLIASQYPQIVQGVSQNQNPMH